MRLIEFHNDTKIQVIKKFVDWAIHQLKIDSVPSIKYSNDKDKVKDRHTFGTTHSDGVIWVYIGERNTADVLRTLCHELVHHKQFEVGSANDSMDEEHRLRVEDEANALAGRMLRSYGLKHAEIYEGKHGSIQADVAAALPATYAIPELKNSDAYMQYRFGVAMAGAKGAKRRQKDGVEEFSKETLWGENAIVSSIDPDIGIYIDDALNQLGIKGKRLISTVKSEEAADVGSKSPVKPFTGYPR